jgi:SAM-dependent methyltransferase
VDPEKYAENARFVSNLGMPVIELLSPQPGERILDLGCGDGALTIKLSSYGCSVVGVDSSPAMIKAAKSLRLDAHVMDGQSLRFSNEFDAIFSNAALHWMNNPKNVVAGVWRALKPGGRFVGEFGGHGNVSAIISAIESALVARGFTVTCPWFFPRLEEYQELLETSGSSVNSMMLFPRPTPLPSDVRGWLEVFSQPYTSALPATARDTFISEIVENLRPILCGENGIWEADYIRLRFSANKLSEGPFARGGKIRP